MDVVYALEGHAHDYAAAAVDAAIDIHLHQPEGAPRQGCACCPGAVLRLRWGLPEAVCSTGCAALL